VTALGDETPARFRAGEGPPLLLLHGLAMSWRVWRPLLEALCTDHHVIAPTLPGHRGGPAAPADVSVTWLADYLETMLDEEGQDRVHVVGNSLGGRLALELAHRGRARSVTAVSPAGAWRNGSDQRRVHTLLRTADALNRFPPGASPVSAAMVSPQVRRAVLRGLMERGDRVALADARGILHDAHACSVVPALLRAGRRDSFEPTEPLPCPVRVVWGRRDRVIPYERHGRPLMARLPGVAQVSLPGAGHVPTWDAPVLLTSLVRELVLVAERVETTA
jgi:pimeloyl-ACP methyl ester carboxylesterase